MCRRPKADEGAYPSVIASIVSGANLSFSAKIKKYPLWVLFNFDVKLADLNAKVSRHFNCMSARTSVIGRSPEQIGFSPDETP